jgi:aspartokinase/homoserine dehydrogenase 1
MTASTAALRKASTVTLSTRTLTTNLLPYAPGFGENEEGDEHDSVQKRPTGWNRTWVLKYGGSSVGQRLPRVCESIFEHVVAADDTASYSAADGGMFVGPARVAVVVSAMGKSTDLLLDAAGAAQVGDVAAADSVVDRIRILAVDNARTTFEHFAVSAEVLARALEDVSQAVNATLAGLTDYLKGVSLLRDLSPRTLDAILSYGERVSAAVVARVLDVLVRSGVARGGSGGGAEKLSPVLQTVNPTCVEATEFMTTDDSFGQARLSFDHTRAKLHEAITKLPEGVLPVFTGFIGRSSESGAITTLGRNGSDYSAAVIAAALGAERVIINTDVPGIFTADPRLVPDAFPVPEMSYEEAVELAIYGSKIFHPKTMLPLMRHGVPMVIRNTGDAPGAPSTVIQTLPEAKEIFSPLRRGGASALRLPSIRRINSGQDFVRNLGYDDEATPSGDSTPRSGMERSTLRSHVDSKVADADVGAVCIASLEDMSFITIRAEIDESAVSEVSARAMHALERAGLAGTWSDQRAGNDASILVRRQDREKAAEVLNKEFKDMRLMELSATEPVTLLSLVPKQSASRVAAASRFFTALSKANVKVHRVVCGASTASISCLIDAQETALAVRTAHNAFNFAKRVVSLLLLGQNRTSRGLVEALLRRQRNPNSRVDLRVCAVLNQYGPICGGSDTVCGGDEGVPLRMDGLPLQEVLEEMGRSPRTDGKRRVLSWSEQYAMAQSTILSALRRLPTPIIVDCNRIAVPAGDDASLSTGSVALLGCYLTCLEHGVRVAVSNCGTMNVFATALRVAGQGPPRPLQLLGDFGSINDGTPAALLERRRQLLRYDSAASAGPPLLEIIRDQIQAGRRLSSVEGALSGSLGWILDQVGRCGCTVRAAAEAAYTMGIFEPRLGSDLSGRDVLQKLRVVAFALGCELAEEDVNLTPLIPHDALPDDTPGFEYDHASKPQAVFEALESFDVRERFAQRASESHKAGRRWRYLATLDLRSNSRAKATIGLKEVDEEHFAFPIRGQEIVVALWEDARRGDSSPPQDGEPSMPTLVLRGQGAGKAAGEGVLGDVMKLVGL